MRLFSRINSEVLKRRQPASSRTPTKVSESRQGYAFRRGRTLTGSASPLVHTTNEAQADLKSPRVHTHMLAKKRRHLGGLFILTLTVAAFFFVLLNQFTAGIVLQASPDSTLQLDKRYVQTIDSYLADHPAERLRFFLNTDRLLGRMQAAAPEVKSLDIQGSAGFGSSLFVITPRTPSASWDINGKKLYVDENGVPFGRNYFSSPPVVVTDSSGVPLSPGETVASNRFLGFVGQVIGRSKAQGYTVTGIMIPPGMTRQIEVRLVGVGYPIRLSSDRKVGEEVEDMVRAVGWMKSRKLSPEYLDVRTKGKVFYR